MSTHEIKDRCRRGLLQYTRKAFLSIPPVDNPEILDIGCGTGVPTLEIAMLTGGHVTAVDSDSSALACLKTKIHAAGYEDRITLIQDSVFTPSFYEKQFDIIVAEGLFNMIGFEKGLRHFTPFLKTNGHFLIHDEATGRDEKHALFKYLGYTQILSFELDESVWWNEYCACLEKAIQEYRNCNDFDRIFAGEIQELDMYRRDPSRFRSIYYVLRKDNDPAPANKCIDR